MKVDMSPKAVTARLKRVSQLRRLCLSLGEAGRKAEADQKLAEQALTAEPEEHTSSKPISPAR